MTNQWKPIESAPDHEWVMVRGGSLDAEEPAIRGWERNEDEVDVSGRPKSDGWYAADYIRVVPAEWRELKEGE